jgi:hypothetical protein
MRFRKATAFAIIACVVGVLVLSACSSGNKRPALTSSWPVANAEHVVPRPETPPRWPLTGLDAPSEAATTLRVVSVKIENSPAARPQSGLNQADVVYESIAEGGITRFNALFHSRIPKTLGPVRSARLSDTWIVPQYNALFFFSGASNFVNGRLKAAQIPVLSEDAGVTRPYFRSTSRRAPHNLYIKGDLARPEGIRRGYPATQTPTPLSFDYRRADATPTVTSIYVPFSPFNKAQWTYDRASHTYRRQTNGKNHMDAATGKQVATRNVVVMWAVMRSSGHPDVNDNETYDIGLGGKNRVSVFHDGQRFDGTWYADRKSPPVFKSGDGTVIRLAPGSSWFEVIATSVNITLK